MPSTQFLDSLIAAQSDQALTTLLTFEHPSLSPPIRVTNNTQDIVSGGQTFIAFPFALTPPSDSENTSSAGIAIANADRRISAALEGLLDPVKVTIQMVLTSSPSTIEIEYKFLDLVDVSRDIQFLRGSIVRDQAIREQYPSIRVTPGRFPSLYY